MPFSFHVVRLLLCWLGSGRLKSISNKSNRSWFFNFMYKEKFLVSEEYFCKLCFWCNDFFQSLLTSCTQNAERIIRLIQDLYLCNDTKKISEYFCGGRLIQSTRIRVDSNHLTKKPYFDPSIQYDSHAKGPSINYGVKRDWRTVKESGNLDGFHNKPSSKEIDDGLSKHWDFWRRILWTPPTKIHHILMPDVIV